MTTNTTLAELGVILEEFPPEEDVVNLHVIATNDELSMRKSFPMTMGPYTFTSRDQFVSYVAHWIIGDEEGARTIAGMKRRSAASFALPDEGPLSEWSKWAIGIAYIIAKANEEKFREPLLAVTLDHIGASGRDSIWGLGQDKTTAGRNARPHAWGLNAWGRALSRLRMEILAKNEEIPEENDEDFTKFLSLPIGKDKVSDKLAMMKVDEESIWENNDAVDSFMVAFRQASRLNGLNGLKEWVSRSKTNFLDTWDFISSLPTMNKVSEVFERDRVATQAFLDSLSSVEKCKRCGSNVLVSEQQTRSADEPPTTVIKCFNTSTCGTKRYDKRTGREYIEPRVYPYSVAGRALVKY